MSALLALSALAAAALATTAVAVEAVRRWTLRRGLLDTPGARSSHRMPTPTAGGIGIAIAVLGGIVVTGVAGAAPAMPVAVIAVSGLVMAAVGLADDLRGLSAITRLILQIATASFAIVFLETVRSVTVPGAGVIELGPLAVPLTLLWIVGMTNVFNFMDGIDGLAGSQAVMAGAVLAVAGVATGNALLAAAGAVIAGANLGFLLHNWPPARIFMGDVGSAFLGLLIALLAIQGSAHPSVPTAAILVVWPFLFDAGFTLLRRLLRGENVFEAHRSHLYQRLTIAGRSHRQVTTLYVGLMSLGALAAIAEFHDSAWLPWLAAAVPAAGALLWLLVTRVEARSR